MRFLVIRAVGNLLALYMLLILLRWFSPWLEFDIRSRRWGWIPRVTDPLINKVRRLLPHMGPMDFAPLGALLVVWLARLILLGVLART